MVKQSFVEENQYLFYNRLYVLLEIHKDNYQFDSKNKLALVLHFPLAKYIIQIQHSLMFVFFYYRKLT